MNRQSQRGFSLLEMMAALAIGMGMLFGLTTILDSSLQDTKGQQTAQYQTLFSSAAKRYLDDNYSSLIPPAAPIGTTLAVSLATLQGGITPYLPASFAATNAYQQTPCLLVRKNTATQLEALIVTEGGTAIPDADIGYVAANAGTGGGSILQDPILGLIARGAYGSWLLGPGSTPMLSDFTGTKCSSDPAASANNGHLATALFYGNGASATDFLYRVATVNPKYNTMSTPILMGGAATSQVAGDPCGNTPALAMDSNGKMLTCDLTDPLNHVWVEPLTNSYWKDPVPDLAALTALTPSPPVGEVRATLSDGLAYMSDGAGKWHPLGQDWNGNLTMAGNLTMTGTVAVPAIGPTPAIPAIPGNITTPGLATVGHLETDGHIWMTGDKWFLQKNGGGIAQLQPNAVFMGNNIAGIHVTAESFIYGANGWATYLVDPTTGLPVPYNANGGDIAPVSGAVCPVAELRGFRADIYYNLFLCAEDSNGVFRYRLYSLIPPP